MKLIAPDNYGLTRLKIDDYACVSYARMDLKWLDFVETISRTKGKL